MARRKPRKAYAARRTPDHQAAVLARRTGNAAGTHRHPVPRGRSRRAAITEQLTGSQS